MQLYAGLEKYSCDMCGKLGEKPTHTVIHKDGERADICSSCYAKCIKFPKFNEGIKSGAIKLVNRR